MVQKFRLSTGSGRKKGLLLLFNTTRTTSGPPSTRATVAMDGGVADTARANTTPVLTQAVNRQSLGEGRAPV
jgi:hypothetical protein